MPPHNLFGSFGSKAFKFDSVSIMRNDFLQVHWQRHPSQVVFGQTDSSGLKLHYTPNLRPYDAGSVMTGPFSLMIPANAAAVPQPGRCGSTCTGELPHDVTVVQAMLHMHQLGMVFSQKTTVKPHFEA